MDYQAIIDELCRLRDEAGNEYIFAQSFGFRMERAGRRDAYQNAIRLLGDNRSNE